MYDKKNCWKRRLLFGVLWALLGTGITGAGITGPATEVSGAALSEEVSKGKFQAEDWDLPEEDPGEEAGGSEDTDASGFGGLDMRDQGQWDDQAVWESGGETADTGQQEETVLHQPKLTLETWSLKEPGPTGDEETSGGAKTVMLAGETRTATAVFRNRSRDRAIYNLEISVEWEGTGVSLEKTSYYYSQIPAGGVIEVPVSVTVDSGADPGEGKLNFTLEYEDDRGNGCTGTEKVMMTIRQQTEVQMSGFLMEDRVYSTDTLQKELQVQNTGKSPVYNVQVTVEGEGIFARSPLFAGNLEPGEQAEGTLLLYVGTRDMKEMGVPGEGSQEEKYGETKGRVILTYEDAEGSIRTKEETFVTTIEQPKMISLQVEETRTQTNQWWISALVLVFVLLAGLLLWLFYLVVRGRRELADARIIREELHGKEEK